MEGLSNCHWGQWLWIPLLFSCVSTEVTGPVCACKNYGSCDFKMQDGFQFFRKRNVALGMPATMSSSYESEGRSGPACLAVNGKRNTTFIRINENTPNPSCIHTGKDDRNPYWEVDLGEPYPVASITIYWIDRFYFERGDKVTVTVDTQLCHTFQNPLSNPSTVTCGGTSLTGQTVRLSKRDVSSDDHYFLTVCEVEVWVCLPGFFGPDCERACPLCKNKETCSPIDGACPQGSSKGESSQDCGRCKGGKSCNATTGDCEERCEHGRKLPFCNETGETFSPLNPDMTQLALPIAASIVVGSFVIGISIGIALYLRRRKDQHHEPDAREQSVAVMVTEVRGDTLQHSSAPAAQTSGEGRYPPSCKGFEESNIVGQSKVHIPKKTGNGYKPFPVRKKIASDPDDIYENEEY
ncbi:uncharacterized protein LOC112572481 isoform X2 [Pomacea canaliculata]|uniref:uncharacterized protein LOC112572481 isoform X2 n=1 Tax=Pomacea canaliculata TaxID=400727 RepID=UPI000D732571|nr:uncharacterized protein LOC112572481 isoform X2 [Pomacea canaliculata]